MNRGEFRDNLRHEQEGGLQSLLVLHRKKQNDLALYRGFKREKKNKGTILETKLGKARFPHGDGEGCEKKGITCAQAAVRKTGSGGTQGAFFRG